MVAGTPGCQPGMVQFFDYDDDGHSDETDCDPQDSSIYPGAEEVPYDGIDQDCDGADLTDVDGDGHDGVRADGDDCDDNDMEVHPDALEVCDDADNDCDGLVDEGDPDAVDVETWSPDADGDGFGDPQGEEVVACDNPGGHADNNDDCDDSDASISPAMPEGDYCDLLDNDCNGVVDDLSNGETCTVIQGGVSFRSDPVGWLDLDGDGVDDFFHLGAMGSPDDLCVEAGFASGAVGAHGYWWLSCHGPQLCAAVSPVDLTCSSYEFDCQGIPYEGNGYGAPWDPMGYPLATYAPLTPEIDPEGGEWPAEFYAPGWNFIARCQG